MSIFVDINEDMDLSKMEEIIKSNSRKADDLNRKLSILKDSSNTKEQFTADYSFLLKDKTVEEEKDEDDEDVDDEEYRFYYDNIMSAIDSCDNVDAYEETVFSELPSINNKNYCNLIRRIIFELSSEIKFYESFELSDEDNVKQAIAEQKKLKYIMELVKKHSKVQNIETKEKQNIKNNIIFLTSPTGNIYAEGDLFNIDSEYYQGFKNLIVSIEDGTFKNVKRFKSVNNILQGISEVREFKRRIVFDRVSKNTYIIIHIFTKKTNCDLGYVNQLSSRVEYYKKVQSEIIKLLSDSYIEDNEAILNEIKNGLDSKKIVKTKKSGE